MDDEAVNVKHAVCTCVSELQWMGQTLAYIDSRAVPDAVPPALTIPHDETRESVRLSFTPVLESLMWSEERLDQEIARVLQDRDDDYVILSYTPPFTAGMARTYLDPKQWFSGAMIDAALRGFWKWAATANYFLSVPIDFVNTVGTDVGPRHERLWPIAQRYGSSPLPSALIIHNKGANHWVVVDVNGGNKTVVVYDSMQPSLYAIPMDPNAAADVRADVGWFNAAFAWAPKRDHMRTFASFYRSKAGDVTEEKDPLTWTWLTQAFLQQRDFTSCGPFAVVAFVCLIAARNKGVPLIEVLGQDKARSAGWARKIAVWWAMRFGHWSALSLVPHQPRGRPPSPTPPGRTVIHIPD